MAQEKVGKNNSLNRYSIGACAGFSGEINFLRRMRLSIARLPSYYAQNGWRSLLLLGITNFFI
jgi:hypothetical protein